MKEEWVSYRPSADSLREEFKFWHVEDLLNQSADLLDEVLALSREEQSLDASYWELKLASQVESAQIELERTNLSALKRNAIQISRELKFYTDTDSFHNARQSFADKLYGLGVDHNQGPSGYHRAGQGLNEVTIAGHEREMNKALAKNAYKWADFDAIHGKARFDLRENAWKSKQDQMNEGSAYDYAQRRELVLKRLVANYEDAVNRAVVAKLGLKKLFGYDSGGEDLFSPKTTTMDEEITHVSLWVRAAIEWTSAFAQRQQSIIQGLSLRELAGDLIWDKLRKCKKQSYSFAFEVSHSMLEEFDNLRLRGLSVSILGDDAANVPWTCRVTPPGTAVFKRGADFVKIDQSQLPSCVVGRVANANSARAPDLCGQISLVNCSPLGGSWNLELQNPSARTEKFSNIDDMVLELSLAGTPYRWE